MASQIQGSHAVVIGGSMAGVLAARALSDYFTCVTLIERDYFGNDAAPRKGVPQARHAHGLLTRGYEVMTAFFPGLPERLVERGAIRGDMGLKMKMFTFGSFKIPTVSGMQGTSLTRGLLDRAVRDELAAIKHIKIAAGRRVEGLLANTDGSRVLGVCIRSIEDGAPEEFMSADLVIDASGRGSQSPKWLAGLGYKPPAESTVRINIGYASRLYQRTVSDDEAKILIIATNPQKRMAVAFPIEGMRWIVTLCGVLGDYPPLDHEGAVAFARSLPSPEIAEIIAREVPIEAAVPYRFPSNFRRHYEKMARFPEGYLVMGDAICSFNPVYGQGMTTSALEAETLHKMLGAPDATLDGFARRYFRAVSKYVDSAWQMAAGEDFRHPEVEGKRPVGTAFIHKYIEWMHRATHVDPVVHLAFLKVMNMHEPPESLMAPPIMVRVLRHLFTRRGASSPHPQPVHPIGDMTGV